MESSTSDNMTQYAAEGERLEPSSAPEQDQRVVSADVDGSASCGFSLNITFRWRPFVFAIGVTSLAPGDSIARYIP